MKNYSIGLFTLLLILLTIALAATNFISSDALTANQVTGGMIIQQPTPLAQIETEIGLTDGILIMGIVIVLIITLPLVFRKNKFPS
jgi:hypothetical protein